MGSGSSKVKPGQVAPAAKNNSRSKKASIPAGPVPKPGPVQKPVAFEIKFDDDVKNKESIVRKHPPKRFQRLEPAEGGPKMTAEMLEHKLKVAEENRQKELEKVRHTSSRIRKQLHEAKEVEKTHEKIREIEEKQRSAGKSRNSKLKSIEDKQKVKVVKAKEVRDRGNRLKRDADGVGELEKDNNYNQDTDDWNLDNNDNSRKFAHHHNNNKSITHHVNSQQPSKSLAGDNDFFT